MNIKLTLLLLTVAPFSAERSGRIIRGSRVDPPFKYPWMAAVLYEESVQCGGTMISEDKMVTAAHCLERERLNSYAVETHRFNLTKPYQEEQGHRFKLKRAWFHSKYSTKFIIYDMAVAELSSDEQVLGHRRTVVRMDNRVERVANRPVRVIGWGETERNFKSDIMLQTTVPLVPTRVCQAIYATKNDLLINESNICAGGNNYNTDGCSGDSGGPLFFIDDHNRPVLVGVASSGEGCANLTFPAVYMKIAYFRPWIIDLIKNPDSHKPTLNHRDKRSYLSKLAYTMDKRREQSNYKK